jgi:non-specific serine/threonine protein kinase
MIFSIPDCVYFPKMLYSIQTLAERMVMLEVRLLGAFEVKDKKKTINISSRPAQSLFAHLILTAGTAHRRERLAGMLWPDSLEETARDNLRHALWRVRKALPAKSVNEYLLADDLTISFNASSEYWLDASSLENIGDDAPADKLISVLSEYQGELLPGFYDEWVLLEREHLNSIFENKMALLISLLHEEKRWQDILDWGERWIKLGQKPEPAYRALMSAHAAKGDMSKVAAVYERCIKSLKEFGVEPSEQTVRLYEQLKSGQGVASAENLFREQNQAKKEAGVRSSIPVPLTSFIGREKELKDIAKLLSASRLLTMIGPGGVGKTRLAIQTAHDSKKKFKDGVCWVDLVGLQDGLLIPQEIARALDVREVPNQPMLETLKTHLKSNGLLLVLDNCEHLIEACAQTADGLLAACPKLKILATSRERLDLFNETTWNVPSLPLPEMQKSLSPKQLKEFASIELFVERAGNVKSDFSLTEQNAASVAQICNRLDGIPLAIELASARIKVLSVDEIASRLHDRFSLLTSGVRTALPRQQTLRAAIDWSHDLLTDPEQILFRRLAVFAGGFTLEAAESVCSEGMKRSEILDLVGRLVDKSLVIVDEASTIGRTRYRLLETIREYALVKLTEAEEVTLLRDHHLEYFMKLAESLAADLFTSGQVEWFALVEMEVDNMRSGMDWSMVTHTAENPEAVDWRKEAGLRLVGGFEWFWQRKYLQETIARLKNMLARGSNPTQGRARALNALGLLYWAANNFHEARICLEEALIINRNLDDRLALAWSLAYLGGAASGEGDYVSAQSRLEESLVIAQTLGAPNKHIIAHSLLRLGDMHLLKGENSHAQPHYEEAARLMREAREINWLGYIVRRLGYVRLHLGLIAEASVLFSESLTLNVELAHQVGKIACLVAFAALALAQGEGSRTAQLCGAVERLLGAMSFQIWDQVQYDQTVTKLRSHMDSKTLEKAWAKGAAMTLEDAVVFALAETQDLS